MAVFPAIVSNVTSSPPLVVTVADPGAGVTYDEVKNSLGQYVYLLQGFYVQATTLPQLTGAIKYLRYDADGNVIVSNVTTTVDPYQDQNAIIVDLANFETDVIFNGNSSIQFTVLPQETMQIKLYTRRITSSFGRNLKNFLEQQRIAIKPGFFDNYGNLFRIAQDNLLAQESATLGVGDSEIKDHRRRVRETGEEVTISVDAVPETIESPSYASADGSTDVRDVNKQNHIPEASYGLFFLAVAGASFLGYMTQKSKRGG